MPQDSSVVSFVWMLTCILQMGEVIALTHHEQWDGTGYPNRLAGKHIPLIGRICALADVFDALSSKRCYIEACPLENTLQDIPLWLEGSSIPAWCACSMISFRG
jgi:response regulator RpfG family c-di-GMP phosphodiesterase